MGFPAYLRHLATVASDELTIDPRSLGIRLLSSHLGVEDRGRVEALWGCPCYDAYGIHEAGILAAECVHQSGMHVYEDAHLLEVVDPETGRPVAEGDRGNVYVTSLFRFDVPVVRYNVNDVSAFRPGRCACGSTLRRLDRIWGRSDNMVKLRGTNVFPEAVGALVAAHRATTGEYFCVVERVDPGGRDEMTVLVEVTAPSDEWPAVGRELERRLREALGVRIAVRTVAPGAVDHSTGLTRSSKIKRLLDKRTPGT